ncbi:MAG TPA: TetR/AcrR family transcriptional regulator [Solirubrobacteraceae bacterium]|nr:TetR/AcrR family transcriptional regulator [Solirubrobacteraceae bacterium]
MDSSPRPRSTRGRPAKAPLSAEVILDAAMRVLREEGLDAVTMRRLASELDTGPASLYVYIRNRDDLLNALFDRIGGMVELEEPDPARWREQLHRLVDGLLRVMEEHRGIARVAVANVPTGENALRMGDNLMGLLLAGGVRPRDAAWACDILPLFVTAAAVETATYQERGDVQDEVADKLQGVFTTLSAERFPNLARYSEDLISGNGDERFYFGIDTFLDGLVARAERS